MKRIFFKGFVVFLAILTMLQTLGVYANSAGMDTSFNTGVPAGFNDIVQTIAIQDDGKIIVGGQFSTYKGVSANRIIRLNSDGSIDSSFNIGTGFYSSSYGAYVRALAIQNDGKIIVGGQFIKYKGVSANNIIRLNSDGSIDSSFNIGAGFGSVRDREVFSIQIQSDGKIIAGGAFTSYKGVSANKIVRLNTDGSRDSSFNIGSGFDGYSVSNTKIQSDGKILIGGSFTGYQGVVANRIVRLNTDGSRDSSFNIGSGFDNVLRSMSIQNDGKIIAAGYFTSYQGVAANRIIRLNTDGSRDSSFNIGNGFNSFVKTIAIQNDGKIIAAGSFDNYQGILSSKGIIRLNIDGSKDTSFNSGNGFDGGGVENISIQDDGKILVGGYFPTYQSMIANKITRINTDGSGDASFDIGKGFNDRVNTVAIQDDEKIIIGGYFTSYGGVTANRITRLNADASRDSSFNVSCGSEVQTIETQDDGKIIVGGSFSVCGGSANRIVRLNTDGSRDSSFNIGSAFNGGNVEKISIQDDGKILVGGSFTSYQGVAANKIIRLNTDGSKDSSFNIDTGFDNTVYTMAIQDDGKILVGGLFTSYQGVAANRIIRLNTDGSRDSSFNIDTGFSDRVNIITIQNDGKILIGGQFISYKGITEKCIIRLNADGSKDSSFNIDTGFNSGPKALAIQNDGKILVVGSFTSYQGVAANRIIRLNTDGSRDSSFNIGNGVDSQINTLATQNNGKIIVGGLFTTYNNTPAGYLTQLYGDADVVMIPNSTDTGTVNDAFTDEGYTLEPGGDLIGDLPMSLMATDGTIPVDLSIRNADITMSLEADSQILGSDSTNYDGILAVPVPRDIESVNDTPVIAAFKVGTISESLTIDNGAMTLSIPVPTEEIGQYIQVYNAEDNGVSWYPETTTQVIDKDGVPTVEFTTNSFGDFSITQTTDTIPPTASVIYSTTGATNQDVIATLTGESEILTNINTSSYTFTGNGEFTFTFEDTAGNTGSTTATVNWIDKTVPTASVIYSTTGITNQDVIATLTGESETLTGLNISGYTFTGNGEFVFTFQDLAGNTGAVTATVNWIDKTPPTASVIYSTTIATNRDVVATLTGASETLININTSSYTFSENGSFVFTFEDLAGNTGAVIASVDWIDKTTPTASVIYSTTIATNRDVVATLTGASETLININTSSHTFSENGSFVFTFEDVAGNTGAVTATVNWIEGIGGGSVVSKDSCPNGDLSQSYYDGICGSLEPETNPTTDIETNSTVEVPVATFEESYLRALENGITTKTTIEEAAIDQPLSRAEMAKMISQYATTIRQMTPDTSASCVFTDIAAVTPDLIPYIEQACQLGIMGRNSDGSIATSFNPYGLVTRGEFATVLSRVLWGNKYDGATEFYAGHIQALFDVGIITNTDPFLIELRGYVMLMLMRAESISID